MARLRQTLIKSTSSNSITHEAPRLEQGLPSWPLMSSLKNPVTP
jgi:hypothetical protein